MSWDGSAVIVAIVAVVLSLAHIYFERRRTANAAVIDLMMRFQSVDYHENVRSPAWHCLRQARLDEAYRQRLVSQIFAHRDMQEAEKSARYEKWRAGEPLGPAELAERYYHRDHHRVLDILAFFAALSAIKGADKTIMRTGMFYYEEWRWALGKLLHDVKHISAEPSIQKDRRHAYFEAAFSRLDKIFGLGHQDINVELGSGSASA